MLIIWNKGELILKKVLILEDNPVTLEYVSKLVKEVDCNLAVYKYKNTKDAYQCILENRIDLFIIDIILEPNCPGDISGFKFAEKMRKIEGYSFIPLIFIATRCRSWTNLCI